MARTGYSSLFSFETKYSKKRLENLSGTDDFPPCTICIVYCVRAFLEFHNFTFNNMAKYANYHFYNSKLSKVNL